MSKASELIKEIGMQRLLQDLIDELNTDEDYVTRLKADLETALTNYKERHKNEE